MRGFSKAIITGNLTRDPEVRTTPNGTNVTGFSVAVNRNYRDSNGEPKETVSFIDCSAWGKPGETIAQYARKGTGILVSGRLDQRSWEDKTDGKKRSRVEIVVEDFNFLGGGDRSGTSTNNFSNSSMSSTSAPASNASAPAATEDDKMDDVELADIPF